MSGRVTSRGELLALRDFRQEAISELLTRNRRRECLAQSCTERTSHGKPYCLKHLNYMPYVQRLEVAG